jgi:putative transposase
MRGNVHVRFGGRAEETGRPKRRYRASARPYTYLRCWEGLVFFAFVIDAYSRMIVGWQLASHMRTDLVLDALRMALGQREAGADVELIHHSDRGSQGGFNRSSQHLDQEVAHGTGEGLGSSCDGAGADAIAGASAGVAS